MALQKNIEKAKQFVGKKFGRLTITELLPEQGKQGHFIVKCKCDCGNEKITNLSSVKRQRTNSCGCLAVESIQNIHQRAYASGRYTRDAKISSAKHVFNKRYKDGNLSFREFLELVTQNCFYCGAKPANCHNVYRNRLYNSTNKVGYTKERILLGDFISNGLDRIDSNGKHDRDNVVPCCKFCNQAKMKQTQQDFFNLVSRIYERHCKKKVVDK
jgi:hypothetical protein